MQARCWCWSRWSWPSSSLGAQVLPTAGSHGVGEPLEGVVSRGEPLGGAMTRRDEARRDLAADRSAVPAGPAARGTKATGTNLTGARTAGTNTTGPYPIASDPSCTPPTVSRASGPRSAGTINLCAVLLLIGITATSLLIHVTDWPWWAIFVLVGMPFLTASVWCEVRAVKRSAAEDTDCRGRSTG